MYSKFCGYVKAHVNVCPTAGWIEDFPDPYAALYIPFSGQAIVPINNSNWPLLNDPEVNAALNKDAGITNRVPAPGGVRPGRQDDRRGCAGDPRDLVRQRPARRFEGQGRARPMERRLEPVVQLNATRKQVSTGRPASKRGAPLNPVRHGPLHHPPPALGDRAADRRQRGDLHHLLRAPVRGSGGAARGALAQPGADRPHPPRAGARQAPLRAVLALPQEHRPALQLRLQLPVLAAGHDPDLQSPARNDLAHGGRGDRVAVRRPAGGDHLGHSPPQRARPRPRWAPRWWRSPRRSTGSG